MTEDNLKEEFSNIAQRYLDGLLTPDDVLMQIASLLDKFESTDHAV